MRKQKKQLIIFLTILVIFTAAYAGLKYYHGVNGTEEEAEESYLVLSVDSTKITGLKITNENGSLSFSKNEDTWAADEQISEAIDSAQVENIVTKLCSVTGKERIENVEDLSVYGLDQPGITVILKLQDGSGNQTEERLEIGDYNETISRYYLRAGEENTVFTIDAAQRDALNISVEDVTLVETTQ